MLTWSAMPSTTTGQPGGDLGGQAGHGDDAARRGVARASRSTVFSQATRSTATSVERCCGGRGGDPRLGDGLGLRLGVHQTASVRSYHAEGAPGGCPDHDVGPVGPGDRRHGHPALAVEVPGQAASRGRCRNRGRRVGLPAARTAATGAADRRRPPATWTAQRPRTRRTAAATLCPAVSCGSIVDSPVARSACGSRWPTAGRRCAGRCRRR